MLEDGIDKRCERRSLREREENTHQQEYDENREQPELLSYSHIRPQLGDETGPGHNGSLSELSREVAAILSPPANPERAVTARSQRSAP
jgi:hypothetical protein